MFKIGASVGEGRGTLPNVRHRTLIFMVLTEEKERVDSTGDAVLCFECVQSPCGAVVVPFLLVFDVLDMSLEQC